jgi:transcriptional regulator with XRE-family HTH domain
MSSTFYQIGNSSYCHNGHNTNMNKVPEEFHIWLSKKFDERNWGIREAARQIGISHPTISDILTYRKQPSFDTVLAIAKKFGEDPVYLLILAGLLPGSAHSRIVAERVAGYKLSDLDEEQLDEVIKYINWIQERDSEKQKYDQVINKKKRREGETPPEVLNQGS